LPAHDVEAARKWRFSRHELQLDFVSFYKEALISWAFLVLKTKAKRDFENPKNAQVLGDLSPAPVDRFVRSLGLHPIRASSPLLPRHP
jgi:hypothetical protein